MSTAQNPFPHLSPYAQQVAECYAVVYPESPARTKIMTWLNRARKATTGERGITSAEMRDAVEELLAAGLLRPSIEGRKGVAARGPQARLGTITFFCESARQRGVDFRILDELNRDTYYSFRTQHAFAPYLLEPFARQALINNNFENFPAKELQPFIWVWLTEPEAKPYLQQLPTNLRDMACTYNLSFLVHHLAPFNDFATTADQMNPHGRHQLVTARGLILQGKFTQAQSLINALQKKHPTDKLTQVDCQSMLALMAEFKGDDERALKHIEAALELEKSGTRKRNVYPDLVSFTLSLFSLQRLGTTESTNLFKQLLKTRKKLKIESDLDWALQLAAQADMPSTDFRPTLPQDECTLETAVYALASRWHKDTYHPANHRGVFIALNDLWITAKCAGYDWIAAEVQTVMEANEANDEKRLLLIEEHFNGNSSDVQHKQLGTQTLTRLVTPLELWEYSLKSLEQLALKAKPAKSGKKDTTPSKSRRLIWQLTELYGRSVAAAPIEQTLGKNGQWSGGRKVALKRLREEASSMPHLLPQDIKASNTIQKLSYGWEGRTTYETDTRTVYQLKGHPYVFMDDGELVDVLEQPPVLTVANEKEQLRVKVEPKFNGVHYSATVDINDRRVFVTHFTAAQRRITETIPEAGLVLPLSAKDRLQQLLDALAGDMSIQSDQQIATGEILIGSTEPLLVLEPVGQAIRVRLRVEPLGDSGTYFDIATGGNVVYVQGPDGAVAVRRELELERQALDQLLLKSQVLSQYFDGRPFFVLSETVDALELLDDAQTHNIRCLWPGQIPYRIKAKADLNSVSLNIKKATDWFRTSGSLSVTDDNDQLLSIAQLLNLLQSQPNSRFIELGQGEFLSLSHTLKQQLDTLQAFSKPEQKNTENTHLHPMALLALEPLLDNASVTSDKHWKQHRENLQQALNSKSPVPTNLDAELRSYQLEGYQWLQCLGQIGAGACLADDMGLGKTVQTLALLLSRAEGGPALVVAPTSVVGNWQQEAQRFAPTLNTVVYGDTSEFRSKVLSSTAAYDLIIISYGLIVQDITQLRDVHWHTVVLDEAQAIKNSATQRAKCVKQLNADFRVVTTGTPVQNNLMDLHSLFGFLNPQLLGSEANFRKRFAVPISKTNNEHTRNQLQQLISPFLLRRHKRDVLKELPERTELTLKVELSKDEAALYEVIRQEALDSLAASDDDTTSKRKVKAKARRTAARLSAGHANAQITAKQKMIILAYLTKLRRLCCHPSLVVPDWSGPESKLKEFSDTLHELISSGHRALVFSQFVDHLKIIEQHLKSQKIRYQYLDGSTSAKRRTERVNAFQAGDGEVFLISLSAGGAGLNLTAADYVIHMDPWWNPAVEDQASDRAHRIGQKRPVTIVRMVASGTIEEQIQELHATKRELADSVLAGADSPALDMEAMLKLLGA